MAPASPRSAIAEELADFSPALRDYAHDYEVELADMFGPDLDYESPDDAAEIHFLVGYHRCAALVYDCDPVELVHRFAPEEDDDDEDDEDDPE